MKIELTEQQMEEIRGVLSTHRHNMSELMIDTRVQGEPGGGPESLFYREAFERCERLVAVFAPPDTSEEDEDEDEDEVPA